MSFNDCPVHRDERDDFLFGVVITGILLVLVLLFLTTQVSAIDYCPGCYQGANKSVEAITYWVRYNHTGTSYYMCEYKSNILIRELRRANYKARKVGGYVSGPGIRKDCWQHAWVEVLRNRTVVSVDVGLANGWVLNQTEAAKYVKCGKQYGGFA